MKSKTEPRCDATETATSSGQFEFIVTTPSQRRSRDHQRLIKSHIARGRPRRKASRLPSWIGQGSNEASQPQIYQKGALTPSPRRVGSDFSWVQFPEVMKPYMLQDVFKFLSIVMEEFYPVELCLQPESVDSAWVGCLMSDAAFLHSVLFSTEAYFDDLSGRDRTPLTHFHCLKALRLLQDRISVPNDPLAISDQTIMAVVTLALTAEILDDRATVENHMDGLRQMVTMRGGIGSLGSGIDDLQAKICRVDLGLALQSGRRPSFFRHAISWDSYVVGPRKKAANLRADDETSIFIQSMDTRLVNVWKDLRQFSDISNLAGQTQYKLPFVTFSEIMTSILYRLLHLSFDDCALHDALRLGMIAFTTAVFFRWQYVKQRRDSLEKLFSDALHKLQCSSVDYPPAVLLWLLMVWKIFGSSIASKKLHAAWLEETIRLGHFSSWEAARKALKSMIWIDSLNDPEGKVVFNSTVSRAC